VTLQGDEDSASWCLKFKLPVLWGRDQMWHATGWLRFTSDEFCVYCEFPGLLVVHTWKSPLSPCCEAALFAQHLNANYVSPSYSYTAHRFSHNEQQPHIKTKRLECVAIIPLGWCAQKVRWFNSAQRNHYTCIHFQYLNNCATSRALQLMVDAIYCVHWLPSLAFEFMPEW
jgi:hypothetical protein